MERDVVVDPSGFEPESGEVPADAPRIAVVVSLWFPGMTAESRDLMAELTATAFTAVRDGGGRPVLVDSSAAELPAPSDVVAAYDGLLFLGGGDVDPALYGVDGPVPGLYGVYRPADEFCLALLDAGIGEDRPTLAICRGSQLLAVASGGTLVGDLGPENPHRGRSGEPVFVDEEVALVPGSLIHAVLGRGRVPVRNGHHQAVDRPGHGLVVTARAADGVVEGTQRTDRRFVVGLQWHPEEPAADPGDRARIFGALVRAARR
ncbi:gamma-glutamyl-gamma-aminobutyrate hydrolase family protein [Pseudonocardia nematodicida]|uniref:Gamma-glutamyl-gamma-aminobutyrate hydrolase family protein n=1 Tax=Pseudonocardia nematodicida TaxID=1206997 RepID=A0ABV1K645_9PSEU